MSEIAISLKNVSKYFKRYAHPVERLKEVFFPGKNRTDNFWALHNINLEIPKGRTLGIVGKNGAGKSTLLQIITGTLTPTSGEVKVNGRVSAILELGSGFNPEFTGRQNVFFNGRILGLDQKDIEAKFDEIAAFADIGDFIDHPVKVYSSGMLIRLAFAVAISVEPDILVIDEALAVGDEAFQRKCFARIKSIQERGGTILFVSHSAALVVGLCSLAVLIDRGEQLLVSTPKEVVAKYHKLIYAPLKEIDCIREEIRQSYNSELNENNSLLIDGREKFNWESNSNQQDDYEFYDANLLPKSTINYIAQGAIIENTHITTIDGRRVNILARRKEYIYTYSVKFFQKAYRVRFGMVIKTVDGFELGGVTSHTVDNPIEYIKEGSVIEVKFRFSCFLRAGVYFLNAGVLAVIDESEEFIHRIVDAAMFKVHPEKSDSALSGFVDFCVEPKLSSFMLTEVDQKEII